MPTKQKKTRKRTREAFLDGVGAAAYDGFMDTVVGGGQQPKWDKLSKDHRLPWMVAGDRAVQEFFRNMNLEVEPTSNN